MKVQTVKQIHNGKILKSKVKVYNDAFFEIVSGKYKGNLIHIFSVFKQTN